VALCPARILPKQDTFWQTLLFVLQQNIQFRSSIGQWTAQRFKQPTRSNSFHLLIFLLVYLNLLYMFRATNSPIFRSTFDCMYSFGTMLPLLLLTGDKFQKDRTSVLQMCIAAGYGLRPSRNTGFVRLFLTHTRTHACCNRRRKIQSIISFPHVKWTLDDTSALDQQKSTVIKTRRNACFINVFTNLVCLTMLCLEEIFKNAVIKYSLNIITHALYRTRTLVLSTEDIWLCVMVQAYCNVCFWHFMVLHYR